MRSNPPVFTRISRCPLLTPKRGSDRQTDASEEFFSSSIAHDFIESDSRSGDPAQSVATRGESTVLRLLTGGLLAWPPSVQQGLRVQPEEPHPPSRQRITNVRFFGSRRCDTICDVTVSNHRVSPRQPPKSFENFQSAAFDPARNRRFAHRCGETLIDRHRATTRSRVGGRRKELG